MTGSEKKNLPAEGTRDPAAPSHEHPNNLSRDIALQVSNMLSVDFSTPLSGAARAERIRQLSHNHPAFDKSRTTQGILVKIQQSLRRMPGVSSNESNEIIAQLQEVGQIMSQETSQLVDALMNLTLDQEDTDKAIARMGLEASLTKATIEDQAQTVRDLRAEIDDEKKKREQAEINVKNVVNELHELTEKALKEKPEGSDSHQRDEMIKSLEESIRHLEEQVNNRRSLWVMKHSDPHSVARAIETLADSVQDNEAAHKTIMSMKPLAIHGGHDDYSNKQPEDDSSRPFSGDMAPPPARLPSVFQRSSTVAPPKFGPLQAGPPRAPSAFSHDRRYQSSPWSSGQVRASQGQSPFHAATSSSFSRPPTRKAYHSSRYRPTAAEFQPSSGYVFPENVPSRPGTAFGHQHNPTRDYFPQTPTSGNRNRYGRFHDGANNMLNNQGSDYGSTPSASAASTTTNAAAAVTTTMVHRNSFSGPLIHMTDRSVGAWNECIMEFYALIRAFVERHASIPDPAMAMKISTTPLWPVLLATYHPLSAREATSYLDLHLRDDNPKCCLVTRVIIDYIVNRAWVPGAWTGSGAGNEQVSYALLDLEKDLQKTQGQPSAHRQPLLDKQSHLVDSILKSEPPQFHASKVREITTSLLATIQPLLNRLHNPTDAYRDLEQVADHAWELSSKILTSRLTFDFRFPEVGTRFSSQSMLPIWPNLDPSELQAKHWRVALVTTPVITCRNDTGSNISAHSVALADVYCMQ